MRISDWSSDVCSSDLGLQGDQPFLAAGLEFADRHMLGQIRQGDDALDPPSGLRAAGQKPRKLDEDAAHLDCSHHGHACLFLRACGHPLSCAWPCWAAEWKENCRAGPMPPPGTGY